ncbi:M13 family metallopeptidase [Marinibactrum halimedae]|uniref:Peptidase M13 n=1 Tax=Marinibactrum halimedae TaxID=1444977 RepID=A0AA37TBD3_9GAMM|nr:M13-type metalloendopeptidase [Marinibactrum halimedae]MCD9460590.1 peptidase M13 [Marinibactrum halimedae]GLS27221.1 peptidase M13 [Marinibactrum halimedae]
MLNPLFARRARRWLLIPALSASFITGCGGPVKNDTQMTSGIVTENIDSTVRPQDDLFLHVNGGWLKTAEIPSDKSYYGSFAILRDNTEEDVKAILDELVTLEEKNAEQQKVAALYGSYMDEAAIEVRGMAPYQALIKPIDAINTQDDLVAFLTTPWVQGGSSPLSVSVYSDKKDPNTNVVYVYQSGLSLPDESYYFDESEKGQTIIKQYRQHLVNMFTLVNATNPELQADTVLAVETRIAKGHWSRVESRDAVKTYNPKTIDELKAMAPNWPWDEYLQGLGVAGQSRYIVGMPSYVEHFNNELVKLMSLDEWKVYLKWQALTGIANYLPKAVKDENFDFFSRKLSGVKEPSERWKEGLRLTNRHLGEALGQVYVAKHFPPEAKARMVELVENLREAYRQGILGLEWMGEETKQQAIDKLQKFTPKIGYPDKWKDYAGLELKDDDLVGNIIAASEFSFKEDVEKLGKPVDRDEWHMSPQTVNAYYNPIMNEIVFPAAILQPPFFDLNADDAVNYGAIGGVIGHEMGHGFDDQGSRYNGNGELKNWWKDQDLSAFKSRTKLLVNQYAAFEPEDGLFVNGELTLGENIGDLSGLTIAHKAYELSLKNEEAPVLDGLSGEQRFFFGWAQAFSAKYTPERLRNMIKTDPHSPAQYRVNGVVRNMPEFIEAFDVKESDGLYLPENERVKIW